VSAEGG